MNIRAIKSADSIAAVNRIKALTKREVKDVSIEVPQEFINKRNYMQTDEFLKDKHNLKMFELIDDLIYARDKIAKEIAEYNKQAKEKLVQAINGFKRTEKSIEENPAMNFEELTEFDSPSDIEYRLLRNVLIYSETRNI